MFCYGVKKRIHDIRHHTSPAPRKGISPYFIFCNVHLHALDALHLAVGHRHVSYILLSHDSFFADSGFHHSRPVQKVYTTATFCIWQRSKKNLIKGGLTCQNEMVTLIIVMDLPRLHIPIMGATRFTPFLLTCRLMLTCTVFNRLTRLHLMLQAVLSFSLVQLRDSTMLRAVPSSPL